MGTYFNPDNMRFTDDVNSDIYVDKTGLIAEMNCELEISEYSSLSLMITQRSAVDLCLCLELHLTDNAIELDLEADFMTDIWHLTDSL